MPIAIVTGGNSGIGRATVVLFAERGYDVGFTWHSDEENVEETLAEARTFGVRAEARQMDLSEGPGPRARSTSSSTPSVASTRSSTTPARATRTRSSNCRSAPSARSSRST